MNPKVCRRRLLAQREAVSLERCSCGTLHLTLGAITLRLTADACLDLRGLLDEGLKRFAFEAMQGGLEVSTSEHGGPS
jgi:hypothetical protein